MEKAITVSRLYPVLGMTVTVAVWALLEGSPPAGSTAIQSGRPVTVHSRDAVTETVWDEEVGPNVSASELTSILATPKSSSCGWHPARSAAAAKNPMKRCLMSMVIL